MNGLKNLVPWYACFIAFIVVGPATAVGVDYFIAPNGDDRWSGLQAEPNPSRSAGPFASVERAREAVRAHRQSNPDQPVTVYLRGGVYELKRPFALHAEDSGTRHSPVVWRNFQEERVTLSGGREVRDSKPVTAPAVLRRLPVAARGKVREFDLRAAGVTDFGQIAAAGNQVELFCAGEPMPLARWPNEGFVQIAEVTGGSPITSHGIVGDAVGKFTLSEARLANWVDEPDVWANGYWFWDWADERKKVKSVDVKSRTIELETPPHRYGYRKGQRFYVFNALSELDVPGEWYLDRASSRLYFWPPEARGENISLSLLPSVISFHNTAWVTVRGLVLENTRAAAVTVDGGEGVLIASCLIRNTGTWGVVVNGGREHGVRGCDILQAGAGGVSLTGGDRPALLRADHFAENNHIHHFARLQRTYQPAISLTGVGHRARHNLIHDAPHTAVLISGNEHLIEFNDIHHVCQETGDVGAFYMGRDWSMRGNVVRYNFFHHLSGPGLHGAMAVYLDDAASGTTVVGNVFYRAGRAVFIGGGRDNIVDNNIFVECCPAVHLDARGLNWMRELVAPGGGMRETLSAIPYQQPPWSTRYPELLRLLSDTPEAPRGNQIRRNVSSGGVWLEMETEGSGGAIFEDNLVDQDPHFADAAKLDFRLQPDSAAWALGFQEIPVRQIGLQHDEWRANPQP